MDSKRVLFGFIYLIYFLDLSSTSERYSIEIEKLVMSPQSDPSWVGKSTMRSIKIAKNTFAISGEIDILKNIGDDVTVKLAIYKKEPISGQYMPTPLFIYSNPACKMYDNSAFTDGLIATSNMPPKGTCPIPKGNYVLNNYTLTSEDFPVSIPTGSYKILWTYLKDQNILRQAEIYISVN